MALRQVIMFKSLYVLLFVGIFSGCILSKDVNQLWKHSYIDKALVGIWEGKTETKEAITLRFYISSTNMVLVCVFSAEQSENPIKASPLFCRTIRDEKTGIKFLLIPGLYDLFSSIFENENLDTQKTTGMGMLIPYHINEHNELVINSYSNDVLTEFVKSEKISGGFIREGGNPSSRESLRPFLKNPTLTILNVISTDVVNTNDSLIKLIALKYNDPENSADENQPENEDEMTPETPTQAEPGAR